MRIALLQHNPKAGDCTANARQLADLACKAQTAHNARNGQDEPVLCLSPAGALTGHPWRPLTLAGGFYERCAEAAQELAAQLAHGPTLLLSLPSSAGTSPVLISGGAVRPLQTDDQGVLVLPDTFSGLRLFLPGQNPEDNPKPDADAVLFMTARSWLPDIQTRREKRCAHLARAWGLPVFLTNPYGATDGDVYAGQSCAFQPDGQLAARAAAFAEDVVTLQLADGDRPIIPISAANAVQPTPDRMESIFRAIVLGVRDYVCKCGMDGALIGLSGGMDSALVLCLAAEAVGTDKTLAVLMPSPWSTSHSVDDAKLLAERLSVKTVTAPIGGVMTAYDETLMPLFVNFPVQPGDLTAENLQPRIRGALLMAFANRLNLLTLAPSNKSETAMGYCTLYGDTVGGLEPIGDLYKTEVYALGRWYNAMKGQEIIPEHIFGKAPSAELRPGQTDQDSLPPYDVLDPILRALIEGGADPNTLTMPGIEQGVIRDAAHKLSRSEFKRRQTPPVIRLTSRALGADWKMPAAARIF